MRRVNLGCGAMVLQGWENYDKHPVDDRVRYLDLDVLPWPFEDKSVDVVQCHHVIEHLKVHPLDVMGELHRIIRPGGRVSIRLPQYSPIVIHSIHEFTRYYFNPIVENPVRMIGSLAIKKKKEHPGQCSTRPWRIKCFREKRIGRILPRRFIRMLSLELEWVLESVGDP